MELYEGYGPLWGSWYVKEPLGQGAYGKVYKLERREFGHVWFAALKVISIPQNPSEIDSIVTENGGIRNAALYYQGLVNEMVQEIVTMSRFQGNSYIVNYEDHMVIPHKDKMGWDIFIRMELLVSIQQFMKMHRMKEEDVVQMAIDVCKGLEICHRANIVHRDIKPENLFISEQGSYKIGDFGISRTLERSNGFLSRKGTPYYMAPELNLGGKCDGRVDIYSLGIVLYSLMNENRFPFMPAYPQPITYADSQQALARRMQGEALPLPSGAAPGFARIILKACQFMPHERYSSAEEMRKDLEAFQKGERVASGADAKGINQTRWVQHQDDRPTKKRGIAEGPEMPEAARRPGLAGNLDEKRQKSGDSQKKQIVLVTMVSAGILAMTGTALWIGKQMVSPVISVMEDPVENRLSELIRGIQDSVGSSRDVLAGGEDKDSLTFFEELGRSMEEPDDTELAEAQEELAEEGNDVDSYWAAAEQGDKNAWCTLGNLYENGIEVEQDYEMARYCYENGADLGDTKSMRYLGYLYEFGYGGDADADMAAYYYEMAGEAGDSEGWLRMVSLIFDENDEESIQQTIEYLEMAANMGNAEGWLLLGLFYGSGLGMEVSSEDAFRCYENAAELGSGDGWAYLGQLYEAGWGTEQSDEEAFRCYKKAAELDSGDGWAYLGRCYEAGWGTEQSDEEAFRCYQKAAELDSANGWLYLGKFYDYKDSSIQDYEKARECYEAAADLGNTESLIYLGMLYEYGDGVSQDDEQALVYYDEAWEAGEVYAGYLAGMLCYYMDEDSRAEEYFRGAAELGDNESLLMLGIICEGKGRPEDFAEARECYEKAVANGEPAGLYFIGWMYEDGHGVEPDLAMARAYYEQALEAGCEEAQDGLDRLKQKEGAMLPGGNRGDEVWL